jgi:hypothetical protein
VGGRYLEFVWETVGGSMGRYRAWVGRWKSVGGLNQWFGVRNNYQWPLITLACGSSAYLSLSLAVDSFGIN